MPANTSPWSLPYPLSSDEVASGATNFRELAERVRDLLTGFGGTAGAVNSLGPTSGGTGINLAAFTVGPFAGPGLIVALAQLRVAQTVASDVVQVRWLNNATSATLGEVAVQTDGSTAARNVVCLGWQAVTATTAAFQLRLQLQRISGTGTASTGASSDQNRYAAIYLPGTLA